MMGLFGKLTFCPFVPLLLVVLFTSAVVVVEGCSCFFGLTLCDHFWSADVVLRAEAVGRTVGASSNDDTVYEVKTIEVFKGENGEDYAVNSTMNLSITTGGNSAMCGIYMDIGEEYLIDLTDESASGGDSLTTVGSCGLFTSWDSLSEENIELLNNDDCVHYYPCDNACGEYQECLMNFESYYAGPSFYCADTCDPNPCAEGEECELVSLSSCKDGLASSSCNDVPVAYCSKSVDPCNNECSEFQKCALDDIDSENPVYYCRDVCDPSPCNEDEVCELSDIICFGPPSLCSPSATCTPIDDDPCGGACTEFQECLLYVDSSSVEEYYCADSCNPNPCEDGQVCVLEDVICFRAPCPPVRVCSDEELCVGGCGTYEECIQYTGNGEFYCSAVCREGACDDDEGCRTRSQRWCRYSSYSGCPKNLICCPGDDDE